MKKNLILFFSLLLPTFIIAQDITTHTFQQKISIYFASGKYTLDENAIETLSSFIDENELKFADKLYLQAFTDDRGSKTKNEQIAQKRATSVEEYLEEQLEISIYTKPSEQLVLDKDKDAAIQRKEFRRVEVEYWIEKEDLSLSKDILKEEIPLKEKDTQIGAFFANARVEAIQTYEINPTQDQLIEGKEGTMIQIPANSFVDAGGNIVTEPVRINLQEAFSNKAMILQNLSTTSGDDLLETGGMIKLEVMTEKGDLLQLAPNTELSASLPTSEAALANMQTYEGEEDENGNIDWVASETLVRNTGNRNIPFDVINWDGYYIKSDVNVVNNLIKAPKVINDKLPKIVEKPRLTVRKPYPLKLQKNPVPSKDKLTNKFPQRKGEENKSYQAKITRKFKNKKSVYLDRKKRNNSKKRKFKRDSTQYARAKATYEKEARFFEGYQKKMRLSLDEMVLKTEKLNVRKYESAFNDLAITFASVKDKCQSIQRISKSTKDNLRNMNRVAQRSLKNRDEEGVTESIDNGSYVKYKERILDLLSNSKEINNMNRISASLDDIFNAHLRRRYTRKFYKWNNKRDRRNSDKDYKSINRRINNFYNRIAQKDDDLNRYKLKRIRKFHKEFQSRFRFHVLVNTHESITKTINKKRSAIDDFLMKEKAIVELQKDYLKLRSDMGLLTQVDLGIRYRNVMRIRRLGWLNCDRIILPPPPPKTVDCRLLVEETSNTKIYMICGNSRSVLTGRKSRGDSFVFSGVRKKQRIKLVGLRVVDGKVEMFTKEGRPVDFNSYKPIFKPVPAGEVEDMIAQQ